MDRKRVLGKLLLVGAGGGCLALAIFVAQPRLRALVTPPQLIETEEIIAEVLKTPSVAEGERAAEEGMAVVSPVIPPQAEETLPEPGPLVARRHDGGEVVVLFPAAGEHVAAGEDLPNHGLPPVLTPEEVAAAMSHAEVAELLPVDGKPDTTKAAEPQPVTPPVAVEKNGGHQLPHDEPSAWPASTAEEEPALPPGVGVSEWPGEIHAYDMAVPPPSATREVQAFLRDLGYAPGPLDGIWGKRTEAAWRRFTRDTLSIGAGSGMSRPWPADGDAAAMAPSPDDQTTPAKDAAAEARDEGRSGGTQTDLPPEPAAQKVEPVRVPGTLRGVMGYRLPMVSRQEVPDQVVSGVLIPAHTTFVVLRGGEWELVDLKPEELERLRAEPPAVEPERQPARRGWNPLRLFRRTAPATGTD